jgi:hypothetical protein
MKRDGARKRTIGYCQDGAYMIGNNERLVGLTIVRTADEDKAF